MCTQRQKSKSNARTRGGETPCILIAQDLQKADKNSIVKKWINFYQAVQRFYFLRFSSLFTLNGLFQAVNRRGFVFFFFCFCSFQNYFLILMSYVYGIKYTWALWTNMPEGTDKKQRWSFIKGWLYSMHIFLTWIISQKLIGNRRNLRITLRLSSKDLHVSSGFGW